VLLSSVEQFEEYWSEELAYEEPKTDAVESNEMSADASLSPVTRLAGAVTDGVVIEENGIGGGEGEEWSTVEGRAGVDGRIVRDGDEDGAEREIEERTSNADWDRCGGRGGGAGDGESDFDRMRADREEPRPRERMDENQLLPTTVSGICELTSV
jgi:hypothetical protein